MSEAILYFGSAAAAGGVLATSGDSEQSKTKTESLTNCPTIPLKTHVIKNLIKGYYGKQGLRKWNTQLKLNQLEEITYQNLIYVAVTMGK
ncbi:hypothetical protein [Salmonella enterica]|uniref:hypothetical protein n=1 Tax=Salmonella enterica TaxID=28901 RepID=UPI0013962AE7|nr:hypothetical protein [Salmonella enterica]